MPIRNNNVQMTEATALTSGGGGLPPAPPNHDVIAVTRYEAGPPDGVTHNELVQGGVPVGEDGETFSTTKEEEWVTKKKTELTTTRQIETRVKRQVVLEDGKVVEDSGPIVTTNTTEDTEKQEHQQTEHRKLGDDPSATAIKEGDGNESKNWVAVSTVPMEGIVKEVNERRVLSREETQETCETEDIQHLGDITDEAYLAAVASGQEDIREPLRESLEKDRMIISSTGPRIVHQSSKTHKTIDTEDTHETKAVNPDGFLVTETKRTTEHEEIKDEDLSDNGAESIDECNETSQRHRKTKDQEFVEYVADGVPIGREMRYQAETAEGERHGAAAGDQEWESLSARLRKNKRHHLHRQRGLDCPTEQIGPPLDRKDALTKRPIDFDQEEETRKEETSKWLEHHFGSDSRSSKGSIDEEVGTKESYFNVTIKSQPKVAPVVDPVIPKSYVATVNSTAKVFSPSPEPINGSKYYQGVSEWSERRYESRSRSPKEIHRPERIRNYAQHSNSMEHLDRVDRQFIEYSGRRSPYGDVPERDTTSFKPIHTESRNYRTAKVEREVYEGHRSPYHKREDGAPTPPQRKRAMERKQRSSDDSRYDSGYRSHSRNEMSYQSRDSKEDILPIEEPPPDYSPPPRVTPSPSPPYHQRIDKKILYRDRRSPSPPYEDKKGYHRSKTTPSPSEISSMREKREYKTDTYSKDRRRNGVTPSPSPSPPVKDKKLYQRTRFAADIPPPKQNASRQSSGSGSGGGGIIGQSIRKLVGKIRSASAERKAKQKAKRLSRSPSPHHNRHQSRSSPTYQQFNVIDNNIPSTPGSRVGRHSEVGVSSADSKQVSSASLTQRNVSSRASDHIASENAMHHQRRTSSPVQRYYLGEDPFGGSIYGRENKYDGVRPVRSSRKLNGVKVNGHSTGSRRGNNSFEDDVNRTHSSTLGRFSKSTSRLLTNGDTIDYSRSVQTLPRNIHHNEKVRQQSSVNHSPPTRLSNNSSSHINVSIINTVSPPSSNIGINRPLINGGPAKPARTYKSSLSRSKSFNVHAGDLDQHREVVSTLNSSSRNMSNVYKSNPHLNRLDENPIGLKSPGIVSSIYRSQKDLNGAIIEEERKENVYTSRYVKNGTDEKKNVFLKGLADRAPELYKTLHGNDEENAHKKTVTSTFNHTPSYNSTPFKNTSNFRSSPENNLNSTLKHSTENNFTSSRFENSFNNSPRKYENSPVQTVVRRGSNGSDNYSETYHITSKSDDPSRPSVTDTVQSFSKKTIPSKDGRKLETIESTETKTVTKSRYRGEPVSNLKYLENGGKFNGGGVVIELRNNNYRK